MNVKLISITKGLEEFKDRCIEDIMVYCARVSSSRSDKFDKPEGLLKYCIENKHWSIFETGSLTFEIETSKAIAIQLLRHRSFCLDGDTIITFDLPSGKKNRNGYRPHYMKISELYDKYHNGANPIPHSKNGTPIRIPMKKKIECLNIRCLNEDSNSIVHGSILNVHKNQPKEMYKIITESNLDLTLSLDHKLYTEIGWKSLNEILEKDLKIAIQSNKRSTNDHSFPEIDYSEEEWLSVPNWKGLYEVSNMGRYRRVDKFPKLGSIGSHGYARCSFNKPGFQHEELMHRLVLTTFIGEPKKGQEARHLNGNKLDNRLSNLMWGSSQENSNDSINLDRQAKRGIVFEHINYYTNVGLRDSYDISVSEPWHSFIANGIVVHNCFQELSQRYADVSKSFDDSMFEEVEIRKQAETNRQSSTDIFDPNIDFNTPYGMDASEAIALYLNTSEKLYESLLEAGIARECARMILPMCTKTRLYMTGSVRSWIHFLALRDDEHAQKEIQLIAREIKEHFKRELPIISKALNYV